MNMMDGDAATSLFTMANMFEAGAAEQRRRAQDIALLTLDPYFLTRGLALFFVEVCARTVASLAAEAQERSAASQPSEGLVSLGACGYVFAHARYLG